MKFNSKQSIYLLCVYVVLKFNWIHTVIILHETMTIEKIFTKVTVTNNKMGDLGLLGETCLSL